MYRVGIIGCGKIFPRHLEAIEFNKEFSLVSICDTDNGKINSLKGRFNIYKDFKEMIQSEDIDLVVIATPNSQHFPQALYCLQNQCDILIEKPATLKPIELKILQSEAQKYNQKAYVVLQVRLNPVIQNLKEILENNLLGTIRGVNLIQRWQRPMNYFEDWRGQPLVGGGTLHECGIHYLDIICYLFGKPNPIATQVYNIKHKDTEIEDTIYSLIDFGNYGGTIEVTIAAEPRNLECSLSILGSDGYIKIGGKALERIIEAKFSEKTSMEKFNKIFKKTPLSLPPNHYMEYKGSCPNHPDLYAQLEKFELKETIPVLELIDEIYELCNIQYYDGVHDTESTIKEY